ncbi:MAG: hypothetical protein ACRDH2_03465 [Anaerolineales bacterium]
MVAQLHGIIHGKQIELERETGLPSGSAVIVQIQPKPLTLEEKRRLLHRLSGAWADDTSLIAIFNEIEKQRSLTTPRDVNFNVAS